MELKDNIDIQIDFSSLEEIYLENTTDYILILKKIQQEYLKYLTILTEQVSSENLEEFRKTRHKLSATLLLLKLDGFHDYLTYLKTYLTEGFKEKEAIIANLAICFEKIQVILARKLEELEKAT